MLTASQTAPLQEALARTDVAVDTSAEGAIIATEAAEIHRKVVKKKIILVAIIGGVLTLLIVAAIIAIIIQICGKGASQWDLCEAQKKSGDDDRR